MFVEMDMLSLSNPQTVAEDFICSKGGKYDSKGKNPDIYEIKRRKNTSTVKTDCPYRAVARKDEVSGQFILNIIDNNQYHQFYKGYFV
jgi:hypothetical protein